MHEHLEDTPSGWATCFNALKGRISRRKTLCYPSFTFHALPKSLEASQPCTPNALSPLLQLAPYFWHLELLRRSSRASPRTRATAFAAISRLDSELATGKTARKRIAGSQVLVPSQTTSCHQLLMVPLVSPRPFGTARLTVAGASRSHTRARRSLSW